jgi:hypothetical protein
MIGNSTTAYDQALLNKSRLDKFIMVINLPDLLKPIARKFERNNQTIQLDTLQFSIYGTVVPQIQVPAIPVNYSGSAMHISSQVHPAYPPITVNFTVDNQFNNYWVIYTWLNALRNYTDGTYATSIQDGVRANGNMLLKDYATDMTVFGLDEYNNEIVKWTYKRAFPTSLGEISFNNRSPGEIDTTLQFAFAEIECVLL